MEFYGTFVVRHQQVNNFGQTGKLETLNTLNCSLSPTNYLMLKKNQDFNKLKFVLFYSSVYKTVHGFLIGNYKRYNRGVTHYVSSEYTVQWEK